MRDAAGVSTQTPHVPGYDVGEPLGQGSSATVWRARRRSDGLAVALKVVPPGSGDVAAALREAGLLAGVRHRHIVRLHDVLPLTEPGEGRPGAVALVTQLAPGGSLAQLLVRRRLLSPGELVTVLHPIAGAVADLHEQGVVHGDISTGNIVFLADGMPLLADLGTSRVVGEAPGQVWGTGADEGMVAPEVLEGFPATRESDVYQLGALAWLALVGQPPGLGFDRPPFAEVAPDLSRGLVDLVTRCMAPQPEDRPDAEELATMLMSVAAPEPVEVAPDADPAHGLTRRIRQAAQEDAAASEEAPRPWWRRWPGRDRQEGAAPGEHRPERVDDAEDGDGSRPRSSPWAVAVLFLASAVVGTVLYLTLWSPLQELLGRDDPGALPVSAAVEPGAGATASPRVTAPPSATAPPSSGTAPSAAAAFGTAALSSGGVPGEEDGDEENQGDREVREALQEVVDARAAAWQASDPELLTAALAPESPAEAADTAELARARQDGITYPSVGFTVGEVEVLEQDEDRVRVAATLVRAALEVRDGEGWLLRTPEQTDRVELELVREGGQWRLWSWGEQAG